MWGREEWAIVLLLPSGAAPDVDASPVPEVVRLDKVPHDLHVAVTLLREGGALEQGTVVVYQPLRSTCRERSIARPSTPSRPFADAMCTGGHMECIGQKLFSLRS